MGQNAMITLLLNVLVQIREKCRLDRKPTKLAEVFQYFVLTNAAGFSLRRNSSLGPVEPQQTLKR